MWDFANKKMNAAKILRERDDTKLAIFFWPFSADTFLMTH